MNQQTLCYHVVLFGSICPSNCCNIPWPSKLVGHARGANSICSVLLFLSLHYLTLPSVKRNCQKHPSQVKSRCQSKIYFPVKRHLCYPHRHNDPSSLRFLDRSDQSFARHDHHPQSRRSYLRLYYGLSLGDT